MREPRQIMEPAGVACWYEEFGLYQRFVRRFRYSPGFGVEALYGRDEGRPKLTATEVRQLVRHKQGMLKHRLADHVHMLDGGPLFNPLKHPRSTIGPWSNRLEDQPGSTKRLDGEPLFNPEPMGTVSNVAEGDPSWSAEDMKAMLACPQDGPLHYHHDGCPACDQPEGT